MKEPLNSARYQAKDIFPKRSVKNREVINRLQYLPNTERVLVSSADARDAHPESDTSQHKWLHTARLKQSQEDREDFAYNKFRTCNHFAANVFQNQ